MELRKGQPTQGSVSFSFPAMKSWDVRLQRRMDAGWTDVVPDVAEDGYFGLRTRDSVVDFRILARPPIVRENFKAILVAGQSNAEIGDDPFYPKRVDSACYLNWENEFKKPAMFQSWLSGPFLFSFSVEAASLLGELGLNYLLIPSARGGTTIRQWLPETDRFDTGTLFGRANFRRALAAPQGLHAIWHFGHEASSAPPHIQSYIADWTRLIAEFRKESPGVPVIFAQVGSSTDPVYHSRLRAAAEQQRRTESGQPQGIPGTFMVVTFDLPLADIVHLSAPSQQMLGRRFALAMREHVYGEKINGSGPRLERVFHPDGDPRRIIATFTRPINLCTNRYDNQFHVHDARQEVAIESIERGRNEHSVAIILSSPSSQPPTLTYGGTPAPGVNTFLPNVVRDSDGLPAPTFGPVPVE